MPTIRALAAPSAKAPLQSYSYEAGALGPDEVEITVDYCGICHSDLSMRDNEWGMSAYPFVPGHEIIGRVAAVGDHVPTVKVGKRVGLGWFSGSCMHCSRCMGGDHNLCVTAEQTIVGRAGGFAEKVRAHWSWVLPLPEALDPAKAGPLFCGGITVFNPIIQCDVQPLDRVGVIGIGGLGHMALQFLNKWGCEVTAFTSTPAKAEEAKKLGAHNVVATNDKNAMKKIAGSLNFILSTVNVPVDWDAMIEALAPKGKLHVVGAVLQPIPVHAFALIGGAKSISGSPLGSPALTAQMLEFAARHNIAPVTEEFPMSKANEALEHLESGKARYRIVLKSDWK
jgi:uncharacterized zinc-type alcohol dehydrogenase-like protein